MKEEKEPLYRCSMVVLYTVCRFGWNLYSKHWKSFSEFSEDYTEAFGAAAMEAINKAQAMPDVAQRRGSIKLQGNELDATSRSALFFWKKLRRFILKTAPDGAGNAAIAQAGGAHFSKAREGKWREITALLAAGQTYLEANRTALLERAKMPATFEEKYNGAKALYDEEHLAYGASKGNATDGTTCKLAANNELYTTLQSMFGDAQIIFDDKKSIAKQFSFAAVKRLVTKHMAGIHFTIVGSANGKPLATAAITTSESGEVNSVNNRGVCELLMKVGVHNITVTAPGFGTYSGIVKVDAGTKHRVKITLEKEEVKMTEVPQVVK